MEVIGQPPLFCTVFYFIWEAAARVPGRCCRAMAMRAGKACRAALTAALHAFVIISGLTH